LTKDELVQSTDLTYGTFNDRSYATLSIVPSIATTLESGSVLTWRVGLTADHSNRDSHSVSPLLGVSLDRADARGATTWSLEFAQTTQLPGYTALNSNPSGLFGGNALLGREKAKQLSAAVSRETEIWRLQATLFLRRDEDLVDWTFATSAPFARQANPVDIDVVGAEVVMTWLWDRLDLTAGYTWLDKDADYGSAQVDASFYALNFARHRATLALRYRLPGGFEFRMDNEYRRQEENPLRVGDDSAYLASLSLVWKGRANGGFSAALIADNLTDSEFQPFPGTPAAGRQFSVRASYDW
jgi:outer membrane cobalamin receptor